MSVRDCPEGKHVAYLSQMLADNAVTLHLMLSPTCTTIQAFECGDHFHIGHTTRAGKADCLAAQGLTGQEWGA